MKKIAGGKGISLAFLAALLLLGMVATLAGCGGGSALVGKWELVEGENSWETMEFFKDGTIKFEEMDGEWKIDKGRLTLSSPGNYYFEDFNVTGKYKISGSTLTIIDDDGGKEIYKKVKE